MIVTAGRVRNSKSRFRRRPQRHGTPPGVHCRIGSSKSASGGRGCNRSLPDRQLRNGGVPARCSTMVHCRTGSSENERRRAELVGSRRSLPRIGSSEKRRPSTASSRRSLPHRQLRNSMAIRSGRCWVTAACRSSENAIDCRVFGLLTFRGQAAQKTQVTPEALI